MTTRKVIRILSPALTTLPGRKRRDQLPCRAGSCLQMWPVWPCRAHLVGYPRNLSGLMILKYFDCPRSAVRLSGMPDASQSALLSLVLFRREGPPR